MIHVTKLPNGVRIASAEMPHMKTVSVGIWAAVGGRHEPAELCGVSHFLEHLMFKGTKRRSARQITEAVEGLGGYLNAFTAEDHTCFYAKAGAAHLPVLCDVLGDMILHSQFAPAEIEREREVIREEILMVRDNPGQYIEELLSEALWPGHPLGRPLTGTAESIAELTRKKFFAFKESHYTGKTTLVTVAGAAAHERVVELMRPAMETLPAGRLPRFEKSNHDRLPGKGGVRRPWIKAVKEEIEQTHLALGFHTFGRADERRYALRLLSVILGENMSSRLFQKLRERHGICYSVQSSVVSLADAGALTFFAALEPSKLEKALKLTMRELERIATHAPRAAELRKAQDYTIGQTLMGLESTSNQMTWMGESLLSFGKVIDPLEVEKRLLAVTAEEVRSVAEFCLQRRRLGVAVAGPAPDAEKIQTWLEK
ncbi:MAG: pitrilysin family protein [Verrucomicrobiota bacterium]